jgi:Protein of unknown function (DUF1822)
MNKLSESLTLSLPISADAYRLAQRFSAYHSNPFKAKQVYFNTLAISVVKVYLHYMEIETNWEDCLSYNPLTQTLLNTADLDVQGFGKIECRPIEITEIKNHTQNQIINVPLEVCLDRIGYVFVQIDESRHIATLLGFSKTVPENGELSISELQSLEELLSVLSQPTKIEAPSIISVPQTTHLSRWLKKIFEIGWQTVESFLSLQQQAELAFRGKPFEKVVEDNSDNPSISKNGSIRTSIERGKILDLGQELKHEQIVLLIELIPNCEAEIDIWVKIRPLGTRKNLPEELQLFVLDELGVVVMQATARSTENILINFSSAFGECFSIKISLNNISFTEHFQV